LNFFSYSFLFHFHFNPFLIVEKKIFSFWLCFKGKGKGKEALFIIYPWGQHFNFLLLVFFLNLFSILSLCTDNCIKENDLFLVIFCLFCILKTRDAAPAGFALDPALVNKPDPT